MAKAGMFRNGLKVFFLLAAGLPACAGAQCTPDGDSIITAFAGTGIPGYSGDGGPATSATISSDQFGIASDSLGNVYICDSGNHVVRMVNTSGIITTFAGNGTAGFSGDGGPATSAEFDSPYFACADPAGNVYIGDFNNYRIRKVNTSGIISTFAGTGVVGYTGDGGQANMAEINQPFGVAMSAAGNLLIADRGNSVIRSVAPSGIITTIAGTGVAGFSGDGGLAINAKLEQPEGVCQAPDGNIFFFDDGNFRMRMINTCGIINTIAGNGTNGYTGNGGQATSAELGDVHGAGFSGANIYLADVDENVIREINTCGVITTIAGNGLQGNTGNGGAALLSIISQPQGMTIDPSGNIYFPSLTLAVVRKIAPDCSPSPTPACLTPTLACTPYTPTGTIGPNNTNTATNSPTITLTPTTTPTPTMTFSPTITFTPTLTFTGTISSTPTLTFTITQTYTPLLTPTATPSSTSTCVINAWPDPYNPARAVSGWFNVSCVPSGAVVSFYTLTGEKVASVSESGGMVQWSGRNQNRYPVATGVYFYVVQLGGKVFGSGKFLLTSGP